MSPSSSYDVAIVGSGFGGSILARALNRRGLTVALIERSRHPRFALGESSTPLAALSLERLAAGYDLPDLRHLAAYGRWQHHLPDLGHGLKRGFTFHDHRHGAPEAGNRRSLLVAASPSESLADCHWLRADVDHHLVRRAQGEGVDYFEGTEVTSLEIDEGRVALALAGEDRAPAELTAGLLVDATGSGGLVRDLLSVPDGPPLATRSSSIYAHFRDVRPTRVGSGLTAPYPPERAAVHHLIDGGWIYELRFDDGTVSAGALLPDLPPSDPAEAWRRLVSAYPSLSRAYENAKPIGPIRNSRRLQRRMERAAGSRWVALPHTFGFVDPLFSTGIAWTLRAVERLATGLSSTVSDERVRLQVLERYDSLLQREIDQIDRLVAGAYAAMPHFELFAAYSLIYFSTVSWAELSQRLVPSANPMWEGFLGAGEPGAERLFDEARRDLPTDPRTATAQQVESYRSSILRRIRARDLLGLDRYGPQLAVPVDLDMLVSRSETLGLDSASLKSRLHLLRGDG